MKFNRGKLSGTLRVTKKEGYKYRWVNCLALLDKDGRWLLSTSWRTNHIKKAEREILAMGFKKFSENEEARI